MNTDYSWRKGKTCTCFYCNFPTDGYPCRECGYIDEHCEWIRGVTAEVVKNE